MNIDKMTLLLLWGLKSIYTDEMDSIFMFKWVTWCKQSCYLGYIFWNAYFFYLEFSGLASKNRNKLKFNWESSILATLLLTSSENSTYCLMLIYRWYFVFGVAEDDY